MDGGEGAEEGGGTPRTPGGGTFDSYFPVKPIVSFTDFSPPPAPLSDDEPVDFVPSLPPVPPPAEALGGAGDADYSEKLGKLREEYQEAIRIYNKRREEGFRDVPYMEAYEDLHKASQAYMNFAGKLSPDDAARAARIRAQPAGPAGAPALEVAGSQVSFEEWSYLLDKESELGRSLTKEEIEGLLRERRGPTAAGGNFPGGVIQTTPPARGTRTLQEVIDAGPPPGVPEGAKYDPYVGWVYTDEKGVQHQYGRGGLLISQVVPGTEGQGSTTIHYEPGSLSLSRTSNGQTVRTHYEVQDGQLVPQSSTVISNDGSGAVYRYDYENGQVSRITRTFNGQWRGAWDSKGNPIAGFKADSGEPIFAHPNYYNQLPSGRGQPPDLLGGNPLINGLINGQMEKARTDPGSTNLAPLTPPAQTPGEGDEGGGSSSGGTAPSSGGYNLFDQTYTSHEVETPLFPPPEGLSGGAGTDGGEGADGGGDEPPPRVSPERAREQVEHEEYLEQKAKELEDLRDKGSLKNKKILDLLQAEQPLPLWFNRDVGADQFLGSPLQFSLPPTGSEFASAADGTGAGPTQLANLDPQLDTGSGLLDGVSSAPVLSPAVPAGPAGPAAPAGPDLTALHTNFHGQQAADLAAFQANQAQDPTLLNQIQQLQQFESAHDAFHVVFPPGAPLLPVGQEQQIHDQINHAQADLQIRQNQQAAALAAEQAQQDADHTDFHTQHGIP